MICIHTYYNPVIINQGIKERQKWESEPICTILKSEINIIPYGLLIKYSLVKQSLTQQPFLTALISHQQNKMQAFLTTDHLPNIQLHSVWHIFSIYTTKSALISQTIPQLRISYTSLPISCPSKSPALQRHLTSLFLIAEVILWSQNHILSFTEDF